MGGKNVPIFDPPNCMDFYYLLENKSRLCQRSEYTRPSEKDPAQHLDLHSTTEPHTQTLSGRLHHIGSAAQREVTTPPPLRLYTAQPRFS